MHQRSWKEVRWEDLFEMQYSILFFEILLVAFQHARECLFISFFQRYVSFRMCLLVSFRAICLFLCNKTDTKNEVSKHYGCNIYIPMYISKYIYMYIYIFFHIYIYIYVYICMCVCIYVCIHIYIYIRIYINMHIYIHEHMCTYMYMYFFHE